MFKISRDLVIFHLRPWSFESRAVLRAFHSVRWLFNATSASKTQSDLLKKAIGNNPSLLKRPEEHFPKIILCYRQDLRCQRVTWRPGRAAPYLLGDPSPDCRGGLGGWLPDLSPPDGQLLLGPEEEPRGRPPVEDRGLWQGDRSLEGQEEHSPSLRGPQGRRRGAWRPGRQRPGTRIRRPGRRGRWRPWRQWSRGHQQPQ